MLPDFQPTEAYAKLSPEARLTAQAYGVAFPYEMPKHLVAVLLRRADIRWNGRAVGVETIRRANQELLNAGLVRRTPRHEFVACTDRCLEFTLAAHRDGHLASLMDHFQRPQQYVYASIETWKQTQLRWCVAAGQFQWIDALEVDRPGHWRFLGHPLGIPFLAQIPPSHREQAIAGALGEVIDTLQEPEAAVTACQELTAEPA
ncbi:MAG: hypothetical protein OXG51_16370, partial [Gammaproteobacteria bacterium]|nr:hypothetical protein [Gammaproteobacteria bacterium]